MGCLGLVAAALLALAMPASIARASLVGAYVLIVVFAIAAAAYVAYRSRRGALVVDGRNRISARAATVRIAVLAIAYAGVVTVIHFAGT